jgi:hypothetical protein
VTSVYEAPDELLGGDVDEADNVDVITILIEPRDKAEDALIDE